MALEQHVLRMFSDMRDSYGGFGHGVEIGPYSPLDELLNPDLSDLERFGAQVAVVCLVSDLIDESTHADALESELFGRLRSELRRGTLFDEPMVKQALLLAFESESRFFEFLPDLYQQVVVPRMPASGAA